MNINAITVFIMFSLLASGIMLGAIYEVNRTQETLETLAEDYSICLWATTCLEEPSSCTAEFTQKETEAIITYCLMQPNSDKYIELGLLEES